MLYIFNVAATAIGACDTAVEWHKGDSKPFLSTFGTYTFQADGDELDLLKNAIFKASKMELIDFAWEYRSNRIAVIKEVRTQYVGMGLFEAKLFAEALIAQAEKNHDVPPTRW